jgi:hypothetical protein
MDQLRVQVELTELGPQEQQLVLAARELRTKRHRLHSKNQHNRRPRARRKQARNKSHIRCRSHSCSYGNRRRTYPKGHRHRNLYCNRRNLNHNLNHNRMQQVRHKQARIRKQKEHHRQARNKNHSCCASCVFLETH